MRYCFIIIDEGRTIIDMNKELFKKR